jgi:hypothetical protein
MVLTKSELVASLQNEVRILLHLASKVDRSMLDYRPAPRQRSTIELLRYLVAMGPELIKAAKAGNFDSSSWKAATDAADCLDFDQVIAAIATQRDVYAELVGSIGDDDFRTPITMFTGATTRGKFIVDLVIAGCAAYRTQLFMYLKACGHEELGTMNLWGGVDPPPKST